MTVLHHIKWSFLSPKKLGFFGVGLGQKPNIFVSLGLGMDFGLRSTVLQNVILLHYVIFWIYVIL